MKRLWSVDELGERWTLSPEEVVFIGSNADAGRLGLACQLAFWRSQGRFPDEEADLAPAVIAHIAGQIGVEAESIESYAFKGRSGRRHRQLVLDHLAIGAFDETAEAAFRSWLLSDMFPREPTPAALEDGITGCFAGRRVIRPGPYRLDRLIRSIRVGHDDAVLAAVADRLDDAAGRASTHCSLMMARVPPIRGCPPIPARSVLTAYWPRSPSSSWCAGSLCRRACSHMNKKKAAVSRFVPWETGR